MISHRNRSHIEAEVDKTLRALDDHKPVSPRPFFYQRLTSRIKAELYVNGQNTLLDRLLLPALAISCLLACLTLGYAFFAKPAQARTNTFSAYYQLEAPALDVYLIASN